MLHGGWVQDWTTITHQNSEQHWMVKSDYVNTVGCVLTKFTQLSEIEDMNGTRGL